MYNEALKIFEGQLGTKSTYGSDLDRIGRHLWPLQWNGVFPYDKFQPSKQKIYAIINQDSSTGPGIHWMAVANGLVYDSFGRRTTTLVKIAHKEDTDYDAEQTSREENCGPRCLAWIWVYHTLGHEAAKLI
jgi:hypothetical protein